MHLTMINNILKNIIMISKHFIEKKVIVVKYFKLAKDMDQEQNTLGNLNDKFYNFNITLINKYIKKLILIIKNN